MNKFETAVADVLEVDAVGLDTRFRETEGWCSLLAFGLLVMMENDWSAPVGIEKFLTLATVGDLMREALAALAARIFACDRAKLDGASYGSIPEWDSVNHLRLVMETEEKFGVSYSIEVVPELKTLDDFISRLDRQHMEMV